MNSLTRVAGTSHVCKYLLQYTHYLLHVAHLICNDGGNHIINLETEKQYRVRVVPTQSGG